MRKGFSLLALAAIAIVLGSAGMASAGLVINEMRWKGHFEWIELYNYGDEDVDLGNYTLHSTDPNANVGDRLFQDVRWNRGTIVPPYGYYLIVTTDDQGRINAIWNLRDLAVPMLLHDSRDAQLQLKIGNRIIDRAPTRNSRYRTYYTPIERLRPDLDGDNIANWARAKRSDRDEGTARARNTYTPYFDYVNGGVPPVYVQRIDEMNWEGDVARNGNGADADAMLFYVRNTAETNINAQMLGQFPPLGGLVAQFNNTTAPRVLGILTVPEEDTLNGDVTRTFTLQAEAATLAGKHRARSHQSYEFTILQGHGCGIVSGGVAAGGNVLLIGLLACSIAGARLLARRRTSA